VGSGTRQSPGLLSPVSVTRASASDVAQVAALERVCYADPWPPDAFAPLVADDRVFFAVARDVDLTVLGYVVGWYVLDEAELANLAVTPAHRGKGLGARLLEALLTDARSREIARVFLEVRRSNEAALRLYRARGFEQVGMRKGYYRTPVEDALILRLNLAASC